MTVEPIKKQRYYKQIYHYSKKESAHNGDRHILDDLSTAAYCQCDGQQGEGIGEHGHQYRANPHGDGIDDAFFLVGITSYIHVIEIVDEDIVVDDDTKYYQHTHKCGDIQRFSGKLQREKNTRQCHQKCYEYRK